MDDFEKLGVFYLGRPFDLETNTVKEGLLLYDSKDLVTHAVCVGMTGSGKTGLGITLLEEAAIDKIPAIIIDPKGDLSNLLLTFPELRGEDFRPWINEEDANKAGISADDFAAQQAKLWKDGLAEWGQDADRISRLKFAADFVIYTPGSNAGLPVAIVNSFPSPSETTREDAELFREQISGTATGLLGLLGIEADPIKSREHILISSILQAAWSGGEDLAVEELIKRIQTPPMVKIGIIDVESFYPQKERFELSMAVNNLLAAPGFGPWMEGEPLDIKNLLHTTEGKPRHAIFSISHLSEAERMFFVTLLLNRIVDWMSAQSGTSSLRTVLYMDEIAGYLPPVANPPSKRLWMTLIKQGRAFGVGCVLATQNPVDLDYKALSNAGTWLIGRLQTERDKEKVLEGLEVVSRGAGKEFDRAEMSRMLASLGRRVFLMNDVHEDAPVVFQSRWAMSYLRGPLTRAQIKSLMSSRKSQGGSVRPWPEAVQGEVATANASSKTTPVSSDRPLLPPDVAEYFIPLTSETTTSIVYDPMVIASVSVFYSDSRRGVSFDETKVYFAPISDGIVPVDWERASLRDVDPSCLETEARAGVRFSQLPPVAAKAKSYEKWGRELAGWCHRNCKLELLKSPSLRELSRPNEAEGDFRIRLQHAGREMRDTAVAKLREKYATKIRTMEEQIRRAELAVEREADQAKGQHAQTAISFGASVLGSLFGRKLTSLSNVGRVTTAARGVGRSFKEREDVGRAKANVEALRERQREMEGKIEMEAEALAARVDPAKEPLEPIIIKPTKSNISVKLIALAWVPRES
jgi:hypothetical protein